MPEEHKEQNNSTMTTEALIARVNTREASTLVISTVAASISLAVFALVFDKSPLPAWLLYTGFMFSLSGILYREVTIWSSDNIDYAELKKRLLLPKPSKKSVISRATIFRFFLWLPVIAWITLGVFIWNETCAELAFWLLIIIFILVSLLLSVWRFNAENL